MTGQPFLPALLGPLARIAVEIAPGADLTDIDGSGWVWTDVTLDAQHNPGIPITLGRSDNVSQAGAASMPVTLLNNAGRYTAGGPHDIGMAQNIPVRQRIALDGVTWKTRFQGYMDSANPVADQSATVRTVQLAAFGMLQRLGGRKKPLKSALYRAITSSVPTAYWSLEDATGSTQAASSDPLVPPLLVTRGAVGFGAAGPGGAGGAVDFSTNGSLGTRTMPASSGTSWRFEISLICPAADPYQLPISIEMLGDIHDLTIQLISASNINIRTTFTDLTFRNDAASANINDGLWHRLRLDVAQSGGDTTYLLQVDGVTILSATLVGKAFGQITSHTFGSSVGTLSAGSRLAATSVAVWQPYASPVLVNTFDANDGYTGETVTDRLIRLCHEEAIFLSIGPASPTTMGAQSVDTILNLLRECEAADHGELYDGVTAGLVYNSRAFTYNRATTATLDMGAPREVDTLKPVFDKQAIKNLYQVSRKGGGTAIYEKTTGPTGTALIGIEDAAVTISVDTDAVLPDHAAWLVGQGTIPGFRYPGVTVNLRQAPAKAAALLALLPGHRLTIVNPASKATDLPPASIDLIVQGWTETTTATTWTLALNTSPFATSDIFTLDVDVLDGPAVLAL